jgi:putative SbcD/Mre11-related phosphoesterase
MIVLDEWLLTAARVAIHLPTAVAVIADVHLGYCEARRRGGDAVPTAEVDTALAPVLPMLKAYGLCRLVVAGDLFEAGPQPEQVDAVLAWGEKARVEIDVVPGNHDRRGEGTGLHLHPAGVTLGRWHVVHGDGETTNGPVVQGHEHPCARWSRRVSGPCYLVSEERIILPAFSRDAAGVNVLGDERWADFRCCVIVGEEVLDFGDVGQLRNV